MGYLSSHHAIEEEVLFPSFFFPFFPVDRFFLFFSFLLCGLPREVAVSPLFFFPWYVGFSPPLFPFSFFLPPSSERKTIELRLFFFFPLCSMSGSRLRRTSPFLAGRQETASLFPSPSPGLRCFCLKVRRFPYAWNETPEIAVFFSPFSFIFLCPQRLSASFSPLLFLLRHIRKRQTFLSLRSDRKSARYSSSLPHFFLVTGGGWRNLFLPSFFPLLPLPRFHVWPKTMFFHLPPSSFLYGATEWW